MKSLRPSRKLLTAAVLILLAAGCKQPETIVVDQSPAAAPSQDTTKAEPAENEASFRKLVMGEYLSVSSLDPLFADNAASMRAVQLIYEGLVRLDQNGAVVPGLAKSWEVDNDSLQYTFHLRTNIYYQDSDVFSTGTGRKMIASDVKYDFERMAQASVPPDAAYLFMEIKGYDSYFQEQREVYNPADRMRKGVTGIQAPNDSTVVFELNSRDPQFLKKLATPLAVIYPPEAVGKTVDSFSPVGAGPFNFSSRTADSTLIFSRFQNYYAASDIALNRVDIVTKHSESDLFRTMSTGDVYVIPQLGPQIIESVLGPDGKLTGSYGDRYKLQTTNGATEYVLRYNPNSNLSADEAQAVGRLAKADTSYFNRFPDRIITSAGNDSVTRSSTPTNLPGQLYTTFTKNPFVRTYLGSLSRSLNNINTRLQMMQIQAPSRNTALLFSANYPLIPATRWHRYQPLFRFRVRQAALLRSEISGLDFNQYPWWLDLRGVTLPAGENLD